MPLHRLTYKKSCAEFVNKAIFRYPLRFVMFGEKYLVSDIHPDYLFMFQVFEYRLFDKVNLLVL